MENNFSLPLKTVSRTEYESNRLWFCSKTDILFVDSNSIEPELGLSSPAKTFKKVDFPEPLAPIMP